MDAINYTTARKELAWTMERVCQDSDPIIITKRDGCAVVMMSLADYSAITESDYLMRSPENADHLRKSIRQADDGQVIRMSLDAIKAL